MKPLATGAATFAPARVERAAHWLIQHWLVWFSILTGIWVTLPWLAPILMRLGATGPAWVIYLFYSPQCHQLPQRSYFLFGPRFMVPLNTQLIKYPYISRSLR